MQLCTNFLLVIQKIIFFQTQQFFLTTMNSWVVSNNCVTNHQFVTKLELIASKLRTCWARAQDAEFLALEVRIWLCLSWCELFIIWIIGITFTFMGLIFWNSKGSFFVVIMIILVAQVQRRVSILFAMLNPVNTTSTSPIPILGAINLFWCLC